MFYIAVDLGTTNIKVAGYDSQFNVLSEKTQSIEYLQHGNTVEFKPDLYYSVVLTLISACCKSSFAGSQEQVQIILTGQAESLVALDRNGNPIRNGISWLDMRSEKECIELQEAFDQELCYKTTGQPKIIPTWPITKILWIRKNEPEIYANVGTYLMLKDYIQYRLSGKMVGEYSIYNFTHYFDIITKKYWAEILDYCGVSLSQLPPLVEPCTNIGPILIEVANEINVSPKSTVNVGTLDHFAGMIGTGNIKEGLISETTGTVLSLATLINEPMINDSRIPCHYGPFKDTYVLLPVCESGGVCLEWFKKEFMADISYGDMNKALAERDLPNDLLFLPYITGVNAPDFNEKASGVFFGVNLNHDKIDFAYSIMEGIAHLFAVNINYLKKVGVDPRMIISTGGGAKSEIWLQMKADISGNIVATPENEETACLGAAMIGAVHDGEFKNFEEAARQCISIRKEFVPKPNKKMTNKHLLFNQLYRSMIPIYNFNKDT